MPSMIEVENNSKRRRLVRVSRQAISHVQREKSDAQKPRPCAWPTLVIDHHAPFQADDALGAAGEVEVVGDEDEGGLGFGVEGE